MKKLFLSFILLVISTSLYAQRGCCSWHGGVAGCDPSSGKQICADGTLSPSCTCFKNATLQQFDNQITAMQRSSTFPCPYYLEQGNFCLNALNSVSPEDWLKVSGCAAV